MKGAKPNENRWYFFNCGHKDWKFTETKVKCKDGSHSYSIKRCPICKNGLIMAVQSRCIVCGKWIKRSFHPKARVSYCESCKKAQRQKKYRSQKSLKSFGEFPEDERYPDCIFYLKICLPKCAIENKKSFSCKNCSKYRSDFEALQDYTSLEDLFELEVA